MLEKIFRCKRGQRGLGKKHATGETSASKKKLDKQRARYQLRKTGIGRLLIRPKKKK
jgi:hypothetical protein